MFQALKIVNPSRVNLNDLQHGTLNGSMKGMKTNGHLIYNGMVSDIDSDCKIPGDIYGTANSRPQRVLPERPRSPASKSIGKS